jgi:hypothetical protein
MSVSSAVSSFLFCCFRPTGGHRSSAYYYSSHPTSSNTLYYRDREGGLVAGGGLRMGWRSKPLALQVRPFVLCFFSSRCALHVKGQSGRNMCKYSSTWLCDSD